MYFIFIMESVTLTDHFQHQIHFVEGPSWLWSYGISAYRHWCCEFESQSGQGVQHYVIKFVSDLWQVGGFLQVLRFPPPIKLSAMIYNWNIVESGVKHHKTSPLFDIEFGRTLGVIDRWFKPQLVNSKNTKFVYCFSSKDAALRSKSRYQLAPNHSEQYVLVERQVYPCTVVSVG
jgi:hypothetical protein